MSRILNVIIVSIVFFTSLQIQVSAETRQRSQIPVADTWNLQDLYATRKLWDDSKEKLAGQFDDVLKYKGKLAGSASELLACLEFNSQLSREFSRLFCYASMHWDQDTRDSKSLAMRQQLEQLITDYSAKASFIGPEITQMDKKKIDKFIAKEPGLGVFKMYLYDIQRTKAHRLSEKEEKILAQSGLLANGPYSIFKVFSNLTYFR